MTTTYAENGPRHHRGSLHPRSGVQRSAIFAFARGPHHQPHQPRGSSMGWVPFMIVDLNPCHPGSGAHAGPVAVGWPTGSRGEGAYALNRRGHGPPHPASQDVTRGRGPLHPGRASYAVTADAGEAITDPAR